jgi:hypothetical protein
MKNKEIAVTFWGTRGSVPSPGKNKSKYGGNTSCVEVKLPNHQMIILDGGTGIRELGSSLLLREKKIRAHIFFLTTIGITFRACLSSLLHTMLVTNSPFWVQTTPNSPWRKFYPVKWNPYIFP